MSAFDGQCTQTFEEKLGTSKDFLQCCIFGCQLEGTCRLMKIPTGTGVDRKTLEGANECMAIAFRSLLVMEAFVVSPRLHFPYGYKDLEVTNISLKMVVFEKPIGALPKSRGRSLYFNCSLVNHPYACNRTGGILLCL